jgi:hypothetical protein
MRASGFLRLLAFGTVALRPIAFQLPSPRPCTTRTQLGAVAREGRISWWEQWYPVAIARFTDKSQPVPFVLLNTPIVIWFDGERRQLRPAHHQAVTSRLFSSWPPGRHSVALCGGRLSSSLGPLVRGAH